MAIPYRRRRRWEAVQNNAAAQALYHQTPVSLTYRGRRWLAVLLWLLGVWCLAVAAFTPLVPNGWFAFLVMGLPCLAGTWMCLVMGWAEWASRVDIHEDGTFLLQLPRYRGCLPWLGLQRLDGSWHDVRQLRRQLVCASILGIPYPFIRHWIVTDRGSIMLPAFTRSDLVRNPKTASQSIDTAYLAALFATRTGLSPMDEPECRVGLLRSFVGGGNA